MKFFRSPFLPANYRVHLESQHAEEWADYSSLRTLVEKTAFFEKELFGNTILSHVDLEVNNLRILIDKPIVDNLIGELLLRDEVDMMEEDDDEMVLRYSVSRTEPSTGSGSPSMREKVKKINIASSLRGKFSLI